MSKFAPQLEYNWLTAELVKWKTFDGKVAQGILYKPENFDLRKKYPVIFSLYEQQSDGLNKFLWPKLSNSAIDVPTYASNGFWFFVQIFITL